MDSLMWGPASSLPRFLPETTVAQAHRHSVRRFTLGYAPPGNKREFRLRTTVFVGAVNVTQRTMRLPFLWRIPKRKSLGPSLSKKVCFLFSVPSNAERIFLSILISLYVVKQSSCCFRWCLLGVASQLGHRRSFQCTEAVGYPPFSVPSKSQAPVIALPLECLQCSVRHPPWLRQRSSARRTTSRLSLAAELTEIRSPLCDFIGHLLQAERMRLSVHDL